MGMARRSFWPLLLLCGANGFAGEIPGIPSPLPPTIERRLEINLSNDFLGSGGTTDDFRTQQLILSAAIGERFIASLDHSILTQSEFPIFGRIDQLSATLGYRLLERDARDVSQRIVVGGGIRSTGEFAGDRIQNGFHRLVNSEVILRPYTDTEQTDITAWADADHYALSGRLNGDWRWGYWLRGSAMVTSDGQWDGSAAGYLVANSGQVDWWFGLRHDWRSGYDDPVLSGTAEAEEDLAVALGFRWRSLILETVQQIENDASYGQLRFVTGGGDSTRDLDDTSFSFEAGLLMPDVHAFFRGRFLAAFLESPSSRWQRRLVVTAMYGEPQYEDDPTLYVPGGQLTLGIEWEAPVSGLRDWATVYGSLGAGYRSEKLDGDAFRERQRSSSVGSAIIALGLGMRFDATTLGARWRYRLQMGLDAWIPLEDGTFRLGDETFDAQEPTLAFMVGMSFDRS